MNINKIATKGDLSAAILSTNLPASVTITNSLGRVLAVAAGGADIDRWVRPGTDMTAVIVAKLLIYVIDIKDGGLATITVLDRQVN